MGIKSRLESYVVKGMKPEVVIPIFFLIVGGLTLVFSGRLLMEGGKYNSDSTKRGGKILMVIGFLALGVGVGYGVIVCLLKPLRADWKQARAERSRRHSTAEFGEKGEAMSIDVSQWRKTIFDRMR